MEKIRRFFFEKGDKKFFPPFKNKWSNLSCYVIVAALATGFAIADTNGYQTYKRDLQRYEAGEITREPQISDYSTFGRLERLSFDKENN